MDFPFRRHASSSVMKTDVKDAGDHYELDIDMPGFDKKDIKAELKDGYMTISATTDKNTDEKDKDGKYIRRERYYGSCSRSFYVGENVEESNIKARFENGILKLSVPKSEDMKAIENNKYIAIEG